MDAENRWGEKRNGLKEYNKNKKKAWDKPKVMPAINKNLLIDKELINKNNKKYLKYKKNLEKARCTKRYGFSLQCSCLEFTINMVHFFML